MRGWVTPCWKQQSPLGAEDGPRAALVVQTVKKTAPPSRAHSLLWVRDAGCRA